MVSSRSAAHTRGTPRLIYRSGVARSNFRGPRAPGAGISLGAVRDGRTQRRAGAEAAHAFLRSGTHVDRALSGRRGRGVTPYPGTYGGPGEERNPDPRPQPTCRIGATACKQA